MLVQTMTDQQMLNAQDDYYRPAMIKNQEVVCTSQEETKCEPVHTAYQ